MFMFFYIFLYCRMYNYMYRLTIDNPAIDFPVPSVFWHEYHGAVSTFLLSGGVIKIFSYY